MRLKEKNNGNKFIKDAIRKRAGCVISTKILKNDNEKIIKVDDTITFLKTFAKLKEKTLKLK